MVEEMNKELEEEFYKLKIYMHYYITNIALELECKRKFYLIKSFEEFKEREIIEWKWKFKL